MASKKRSPVSVQPIPLSSIIQLNRMTANLNRDRAVQGAAYDYAALLKAPQEMLYAAKNEAGPARDVLRDWYAERVPEAEVDRHMPHLLLPGDLWRKKTLHDAEFIRQDGTTPVLPIRVFFWNGIRVVLAAVSSEQDADCLIGFDQEVTWTKSQGDALADYIAIRPFSAMGPALRTTRPEMQHFIEFIHALEP